ncbi:DUF350 domain-containing protein [Acaryochloris sp. 'Moss Beach']|uniref:DUF350 domain-containing protein n=1 Tax=Acaryochloris TaxID=155977 RepID=UPI001BAF1103|nr:MULTISPECIES: DUF350 domain-containing protein [Acaryochloris]QUY44115.1 DUF350 domain-containing protein [Acaryochloris marina S15]UJB68857.1 DUF350 domain-containing protein [Acaryochloris sp. 'Moss Beach']
MPLLIRVLESIGWTFLSVVLFYVGLRLYDILDPIDHRAEIRKGNLASGILQAAIVVSLAAIVIAVILTPS